MVKPFNNMDEVTKKWVKEAGLEQPSLNFAKGVMDAIEAPSKTSIAYQPLISIRGWAIAAIVIFGAMTLIYFFPPEVKDIFEQLNFVNLPSFDSPFQSVKLSKAMIYGLGFMALFFLQIPFLKRFIDKNYQ